MNEKSHTSGFPFLEACFIFLNAVYVWETYLDWRQYQQFKIKKIPDAVAEIGVTAEKFQKAQAYGSRKTGFGFISGGVSHLLNVVMLWFGFLPYTWNLAGNIIDHLGFTPDHEILQSLIFLGIQSLVSFLVSLPFSIYSTFVIEEEFGFNKTTVFTFVTDIIYSIGLSIIIGAPIVSAFIWIIQWGGEHFYFYLWVFTMAVQLIMIMLYPTLIQPIFNQVTELEPGELRAAIEQLAQSTGFPLTALYKIDGSKRSGHSNAYFYGFFNSKRIVLFDTLIDQSSREEVVAVLGHELGHYFLNHTLQLLAISSIHLFVLFYYFGQMMHNKDLFLSFGFPDSMPTIIGFSLFTMTLEPIEHVIGFLMNMFSRHNEFQADAFSTKLGYGRDLRSGLIKLQEENLGAMIPDLWYSTYHYSHPPLIERLNAIKQLESREHKGSKKD